MTTCPPAAPIPQPDWILRPNIMERFDWAAVFGNPGPVEFDLGAGDGTFVVDLAAAFPGRNFVAIERLLGRLRKIDRKARRRGLTNVRGLRLEARYVLEWMVPPQSLAAVHVCFPDPWPKRRHWKRRLISPEFATAAAAALAPGGLLCLRTDHAGYHEWMLETMAGDARFCSAALPAPAAELKTDFEREFNAKGIKTLYATYARTA